MRNAQAIQNDAVTHPTLDEFFDRDPKTLTDERLMELININRGDYARFVEEQRAKKEK